MMLDEKLIWVIFLFKMGRKWVIRQQERLATSTTHLAQELLTVQVVVQEVLQRTRELWGWGAQWPALGRWRQPIEMIIEANSLTTTGGVAEELNVNHSMVIQHLRQIGKVKKLHKWVPHELTKNQQHRHFAVSSSYCSNNKPFLDQIVMWWIVGFIQLATTSLVVGLRRSSKALLKAKPAPKKCS